ncbi:heavy metal translocating P-type ATPase [Hyphomicrobium sp. 2TAF46]|uniref:heavy metal translocating P-type ATPase n=1 Tax=Hyphomicrobium sp. 2TAF46 TaxID=3233019 RepID=UPI003F90F7D8
MNFEIRHFIRGRVRMRISALCRNRGLAEATLQWVNRQEGVHTARINYTCSSLVLEYDPVHQESFKLLLGYLGALSLNDLRTLVGTTALASPPKNDRTQKPDHMALEPQKPRIPLLLPTVSLALAFVANPLAIAVNLPLMAWNAYPIALRAWRVWSREGRLNVDFLDTLAVVASLALGNPVAGALVIWLVKLGDWIRDLTAAGSKRAIGELLEFRSKTAWIRVNSSVVSVPARDVKVGDEVVVYPGETIPVDGKIIEGSGAIDQKTITGEGLPVTRGQGEDVFAATVMREGQIVIRATRVGSETTAAQIVRLIDSAPIGDTRMQNHAEKLADGLVTPTLALAAGTAALSGDFSRFLSLVIVDYGTGIRVSAPTAMLASMTRAACSGIIVKSGGHMERLAEADTIVFDKTGTLTVGAPVVLDIIPYQRHFDGRHLLGIAAAAESRLRHPVAEALRAKARDLQIKLPPCDDAKYSLGLGIEGQVNGNYVHIGNERFIRMANICVESTAADRRALDERGCSSLYVAVDGVIAGLVAYADQIRPETPQIICRLKALGFKDLIMLTGDGAVVANAVSRQLGLDRYFADMLPADKADVIQSLQRQGRVVAMVGDGINDSPALSFADVGVAMKHGADVAHESADVVLMEDSLWKLVAAIEISRDAVSLIKENYAIVAGLNTLALGLALPGSLISPSLAALISNGSAILASLNGMRPLLKAPYAHDRARYSVPAGRRRSAEQGRLADRTAQLRRTSERVLGKIGSRGLQPASTAPV